MGMGCFQSTPDPNNMYGMEHQNVKAHTIAKNKNQIHPTITGTNGSALTDSPAIKKRRELRGDASLYREAKVAREVRLRQSLLKREQMARDMSERVMEEKERLSLTSGRSRTTSRATSPRSGRYTNRTLQEVSLHSMFENDEPGTSQDHINQQYPLQSILVEAQELETESQEASSLNETEHAQMPSKSCDGLQTNGNRVNIKDEIDSVDNKTSSKSPETTAAASSNVNPTSKMQTVEPENLTQGTHDNATSIPSQDVKQSMESENALDNLNGNDEKAAAETEMSNNGDSGTARHNVDERKHRRKKSKKHKRKSSLSDSEMTSQPKQEAVKDGGVENES